MEILQVVRCVMMLTGLGGALAPGAVAQRSGATKDPSRSGISMAVTSSGTQVLKDGYAEVRGVTVLINATGPWQLLVRTEPLDSTVTVRVAEVRGPARASSRDFRPVAEATLVASGDAGAGIQLFLDYRFPLSTSHTTVSYIIVPE